MSLKKELDALRAGHDGVDDLVYADITAGMVLYASSDHGRPQELYDGLLERAGVLLAADGAALSMARTVGAKPIDALIVDSDGVSLRVVVRSVSNSEECLIFGCSPGADISALSQSAADLLAKFAAEGGG